MSVVASSRSRLIGSMTAFAAMQTATTTVRLSLVSVGAVQCSKCGSVCFHALRRSLSDLKLSVVVNDGHVYPFAR